MVVNSHTEAPAQGNRRQFILVGLVLLCQVLILWMPFGLRNRPIAEEWYLFSLYDKGAGPFYTEPIFALRPFNGTWYYLMYAINPDTLIGPHLMLAALFFAKGVTAYLLVARLLPGRRAFAVFVAMLYTIYPADTGLFNFRAIHIHAAAFTYLLSVYLLVVSYQAKRFRVIYTVLMCLALATTLLTYDSVYPLVFLSPLLLVIMARRITRTIAVLAGLWYAISIPLFLNLVRVIFVQQSQDLYQTSVVDKTDLLPKIIQSLLFSVRANFLDGWRTVIKHIDVRSPLLYLAVAFALLAGWLIWRNTATNTANSGRKTLVLLIVVGILIVPIGYLPYSITTARFDDWRAFYVPSFGSTLAVGAAISLVSLLFRAKARLAFAALGALCVGGGMLYALQQHARYADDADKIRSMTADIVSQVPRLKTKAALLITWDANAGTLIFPDSLRYIYQDYDNILTATTCMPLKEGDIRTPPLWISCVFHADKLDVFYGNQLMYSYPYDQVLLFSYSEGQHVTLLDHLPAGAGIQSTAYSPAGLIDSSAPPPLRIKTIVGQ